MKRRSFLLVAATAGIAGCADSLNNEEIDPDSDSDSDEDLGKNGFAEYEWKYRIPGEELTVSEGTLYGFEEYPTDSQQKQKLREESDIAGRVFSLNLQNGNRQWACGSAVYGHEGNRNLTIRDAIYYETVNDVNVWMSSIELDGTKRWTGREGHDTFGGKLKHVSKDAVYVTDYDRNLKAIDTASGELLWHHPVENIHFDTAAGSSSKTAYINKSETSDTSIAALDMDEGSIQWLYEHEENYIIDIVSDGVVYATNNGSLAAISDGEERWQVKPSPSSDSLEVHGIASELVLVKDDSHLYALNDADGKKQWEREMTHHRRSPNRLYEGDLRIHENRIYSGKRREQEISVFKLDDGTKLWSTDIGSEIESWEIVSEEQFSPEESVFVQTSRALHRVNLDGEVTQTWSPRKDQAQGEQIHDFVVDEYVIISTDSGIYALEPQ